MSLEIVSPPYQIDLLNYRGGKEYAVAQTTSRWHVDTLIIWLIDTFDWLLGALDVTEGVGAAFGIPNVPELWEEMNRPHSRSRASRSPSRSISRSALPEVRGENL